MRDLKRQAQHVAKRKCNTNERVTEAAARPALCRLVCRLGNIQHQPVCSSNCSRQASKLRLCDLEDSTLPAKQVGLSRLGAGLMRPMLWEQLHIASSVSPVSCHLVAVLPHAQTQISLYNIKTLLGWWQLSAGHLFCPGTAGKRRDLAEIDITSRAQAQPVSV